MKITKSYLKQIIKEELEKTQETTDHKDFDILKMVSTPENVSFKSNKDDIIELIDAIKYKAMELEPKKDLESYKNLYTKLYNILINK